MKEKTTSGFIIIGNGKSRNLTEDVGIKFNPENAWMRKGATKFLGLSLEDSRIVFAKEGSSYYVGKNPVGSEFRGYPVSLDKKSLKAKKSPGGVISGSDFEKWGFASDEFLIDPDKKKNVNGIVFYEMVRTKSKANNVRNNVARKAAPKNNVKDNVKAEHIVEPKHIAEYDNVVPDIVDRDKVAEPVGMHNLPPVKDQPEDEPVVKKKTNQAPSAAKRKENTIGLILDAIHVIKSEGLVPSIQEVVKLSGRSYSTVKMHWDTPRVKAEIDGSDEHMKLDESKKFSGGVKRKPAGNLIPASDKFTGFKSLDPNYIPEQYRRKEG